MRKELAAFAQAQATLDELRAVNTRLAGQLLRARVGKDELVEAVYRGAKDAAAGLSIPPVPVPKLKDGMRGTEEVAVIVLSDLQLAKRTPTYNTRVCEQRVERMAEKVARMVAIQRSDHPVQRARVYLLGDIVEGELIFGHQAHQIDGSLYQQVAVTGPRIVTGFLRRMLALFEAVHVVGVVGNHGELGGVTRRSYNPTTNADRILYRFCQQLLAAEKRLTWHIPDMENEHCFYAVDYPVGEHHGFMLFHGNQLNKDVSQWPRRIALWRSGGIPEPFRYSIHGHWHTPVRLQINELTAFCNGSTESTNTYAQERLSAVGKPEQFVCFVHPKHGITGEYWVKL